MTTSKAYCAIGLILGIAYIAKTHETSFAFDRPLLTLIVLLLSSGQSLVFFQNLFPFPERGGTGKHAYLANLDKDEDEEDYQLRSSPILGRVSEGKLRLNQRSPLRIGARGLFYLLVIALCIRAEVSRRVINDSHCPRQENFYFVPLAYAIYEYFTVQRNEETQQVDDDMSTTVFESIYNATLRSKVRYIALTFALGLSSLETVIATSAPNSSYICLHDSSTSKHVPVMQILKLLLDVGILITVTKLLDVGSRKAAVWTSAALLASGTLLAVVGTITALFQGTLFWISLRGDYVWSLIGLSIAVSLVAQCALRLICQVGPMTTSLLAVASWTYCVALFAALTRHSPFPPVSRFVVLLSVIGILSALYFYFSAESLSEGKRQDHHPATFFPLPLWLRSFAIGLFSIQFLSWATRTVEVRYHPVDALMQTAIRKHDEWTSEAISSSIDLVTQAYRERYHRNPPPRFDAWYDYAVNRSTVVLNNYDSIQDDLAVFWSVPASELRKRTAELLQIPNDVGGIRVRNGALTIMSKNEKQHQSLEGMSVMMDDFVKYLPDMDIAINSVTDGRVLFPWDEVQNMRTISEVKATMPERGLDFSEDRASGWEVDYSIKPPKSYFRQHQDSPSFEQFAFYSCPANSAGRSSRPWNKAQLCVNCALSHSLGQYVKDWSVAGSICHQPDLAYLHGFYAHRSPVRISHDILPLFSVRKTSGFSDILFPSPEDYKKAGGSSKSGSDISFDKKKDKLFWRGSASEGFSQDGEWKGMTPQRLDYLANEDPNRQAMLLATNKVDPSKKDVVSSRLFYAELSSDELRRQIPRDVHLTNLDRDTCSVKEFTEQSSLFKFVDPAPLKEHFRHRYLLTLDDDLSSNHFLDFLRSHSVPLRASIFRHWYDDRIKPWVHFIPIDIRLHGLWSSIGYFRGVKHKGYEWEAHKREASLIAKGGQEWAQQALRKEDMEIYLFRLLLEWGRVTDDARDKLGFLPD